MEEEDPNPRYKEDKRNPIFRRDRHLQSALSDGEIVYMMENWDNEPALKREHISLKRATEGITFLPSEQYIHWALLHINKVGGKTSLNRELARHVKIANDAVRVSCLDYCGLTSQDASLQVPERIQGTYTAKKLLSSITRQITFSERYTMGYTFFGCPARCFGNLHVVWPSDRFAYVVTHSHFLAVRDCINSWFSALIYSYYASRKYPGYNLYDEVSHVIDAVMHDIGMYKDDTYTILKNWQPLVISTLLKDVEGDPSFYSSLIPTLEAHPDSHLYQLATRPITDASSVHMALELTGLTKCFGHPEVKMDASVASWIEKGTVLKRDLEDVAEKIRQAFVLEFSRNYYKSKRRWPKLVFSPSSEPYIQQCYNGNYWGELVNDPWSPEMFAGIQFGKTLDFDYQIYTADLLADKAIIPCREHWPYEYDAQAHRTVHGFFPRRPPRQSTNVILQYLSREEVNVRSIIDTVSEERVPVSWKVTVGVAKEREMKKEKARFYGKLTLEMRLFQVATENNIKHIFKYIPHQTMTKSEDDLFKHLLKMSETSAQDDGGYVFISMDFSSWCTSFRYEGVTPLFEELDRLLGIHNVFSYTQKFPLESILLFQDRFNPPRQGEDGDPLNGRRCFIGPEAWMEGLRQKGWTLATLLLILIASWMCGTIATLTGQGDNQVVYLRLPNSRTLEKLRMTKSQYIRWYQETLQTLCRKAGITLKLEETWVSSCLLEYGREFFYKGAQVSSTLKRISRMASEANQTIPSFNGDMAGIYSAGMGAAQKDHLPIPSYWCTILEASILAHDRHPSLCRYPLEYVTCLLSVPRSLGGWPLTLFSNFATRAVQDQLTTSLHLVRTFMKSHRHRDHILRIATTEMRKTDYSMLIKDPQSLPLVMPRQPENYLKTKIAEGLPSIIKNKELIPLFTDDVSRNRQDLIDDLMAIRPCNPKLLSKIMTLSNIGKQDALVSKFSSTRSIQNVACREWSSEIDVLHDIRAMENTMMDHIRARREDPLLRALTPTTCLTQYAHYLRETGWDIQLEGITMPAQQEQTQLCVWSNIPLDMYDRSISLSCEGDPAMPWHLVRGPASPYIGAPTKIRAKRQPLQEVESYSFTQALSQALQLRSWVKGSEGLTALIDTIIQEKTDASEEELDRRTSHVYSGSLTHRLPCPTMSRGGQSNTTSNFASHIRISSSTATRYAKKGEDYTICFQSVFLYGLASLNMFYHKYGSIPQRMGIVISRGCCTWTIPPEVFTLTQSLYKGVMIPSAVLHIEPTQDAQLPYDPPLLDVDMSYAAHMAHKFAVWILNRRDTSRISTLEHRAIQDALTPPFVNLSEICRVNLQRMLELLSGYLVLLDHNFCSRPNLILSELKDSSTRTGFDDLIDSVILGGLTHSFCAFTHASPIDLQSRSGWRISLADIISAEIDKGLFNVLTRNIVLLPEETKHLFSSWYRSMLYILRRRVTHDHISTMSSSDIIDCLERAVREAGMSNLGWPMMALSEEESIAGIRQKPRPSHRPLRSVPVPVRQCPSIIRMEQASVDIEEAMYCLAGGRVTNQIYEIFIILKEPLQSIYHTDMHLYTIGDRNGVLYSLVCHLMGRVIQDGAPFWNMSQTEARSSLETGPSCVTGDPCTIPYSHGTFLANLDNKGPIRVPEVASRVPSLWICLSGYGSQVPEGMNGVILVQGEEWGRSGWEMVHTFLFQQVRGSGVLSWHLWMRGGVLPIGRESRIGLGNSTLSRAFDRPMECATLAQTLRTPCFSVLAPMYHLMQGNPTSQQQLLSLVDRGLSRCMSMLPDLAFLEDGASYMEPIMEREIEIRSNVADRIAILGLVVGLMMCPDPRLAIREGSVIRFHIHYDGAVPRYVCQGKCRRGDNRLFHHVRRYTRTGLLNWWKPSVLLVASVGGRAQGVQRLVHARIRMAEEWA